MDRPVTWSRHAGRMGTSEAYTREISVLTDLLIEKPIQIFCVEVIPMLSIEIFLKKTVTVTLACKITIYNA